MINSNQLLKNPIKENKKSSKSYIKHYICPNEFYSIKKKLYVYFIKKVHT